MKVDNVVFLLDFVGFEMGEDKDVPVILSHPGLVTNDSEENKGVSLILGYFFLGTSASLPDVKNRHLILRDSCNMNKNFESHSNISWSSLVHIYYFYIFVKQF